MITSGSRMVAFCAFCSMFWLAGFSMEVAHGIQFCSLLFSNLVRLSFALWPQFKDLIVHDRDSEVKSSIEQILAKYVIQHKNAYCEMTK